jgi:hypothetical protein
VPLVTVEDTARRESKFRQPRGAQQRGRADSVVVRLRRPSEGLLVWCSGAALGLIVLGPGLGRGALLNLDLTIVRDQPVPSGIWGLGPDFPRRVPLFLPVSWLSTVVGTAAGKTLIVAAFATAFVGASRLVGAAPFATRLGTGLLYALSPFTLTRLAAGQIAFLVALAVLPWALPRLLRPHDDVCATLLWAAALGCCGITGGLLAVPVVLVGLVAAHGQRWARVLGALLIGQLAWLVPAIVVAATGETARLAPASAFATDADGVAGVARVLAGHGFWQLGNQVGKPGGTTVAIIGVVLGLLALAGASRLDASWRGPAAGLAALGLAVTLASALPGLRDLYADFADTTLGAPLRESQRFFVLFLVWMVPAAALGAQRLAGDAPGALPGALTAAPAALALLLAAPGLWGIGGRLDPVVFPRAWETSRTAIHSRPGTVLALPWNEYLDLAFADGRRCLNPAPDFLGGDVLVSRDPEVGPRVQEGSDPRIAAAQRAVDRIRAGQPVAAELAHLGVRWVFLMHEVDWRAYRGLAEDRGLEQVVAGSAAGLYRVKAWRGPVRADRGEPELDPIVAPLALLQPSGQAVWNRPASAGWLRGIAGTRQAPNGLLELPPGSGPVWYWPSLLVLGADVALAGAALTAVRRRRRSPETV